HGVIGDDQGGQGELLHVGPLLLGTRQYDRVDTGVRAYSRQYLREQRIRAAVIQRDVGWRAEDDHDAVGVHAQLLESVRVGLEVGQVVLLLDPRVLEELVGPDAESLQA